MKFGEMLKIDALASTTCTSPHYQGCGVTILLPIPLSRRAFQRPPERGSVVLHRACLRACRCGSGGDGIVSVA